MSDDDVKVEEEASVSRLVMQKDFFQMLNEHVFVPHLGQELDFETAKDVVHGLGDAITEIAIRGDKVRFGRLGTFRSHTSPATRCFHPVRRETMDVPERKKLVFEQSKSTRVLFRGQASD